MTTLYVRHKIGDYGKWKRVYDEFGSVRKRLGVMGSTRPTPGLRIPSWLPPASHHRFVAQQHIPVVRYLFFPFAFALSKFSFTLNSTILRMRSNGMG
jgi:hypothetical protein